jgi:hypothetical protein
MTEVEELVEGLRNGTFSAVSAKSVCFGAVVDDWTDKKVVFTEKAIHFKLVKGSI